MWAAGGVLLALASLFALLWLAIELAAVIAGDRPRELRDAGLMTNPVHVLDLALFLPAVGLTGAAGRRWAA